MLLQIEKWKFNESSSFKIKYINPCCNDLSCNPLIDFYNGYFDNTDDKYGISIRHSETHENPYDDYPINNDYYYKINYCPFCGKPILIEIISEVDKTEEYADVETKLKNLRNRISKCDSKKKCDELENEFRQLNNLLNSFYYSDSIQQFESNDND